MLLVPFLGSDLFPSVDAGQIRLHVRAPIGTRIEETTALCDRIEASIRRQIPKEELDGIVDNIGFPPSGTNLTLSNSGVIGTSDGEILIALKPDHRTKPVDYIRDLRRVLPREFPGTEFYFQPADIVSQVLNFGLPAPIDIQLAGPDVRQNFNLARELLPRLKAIPGAVDVHIQQSYDQPQLDINVDRVKAEQVGMTQSMVASNALVSLTNSFQTAPNFWVSPQGVAYQIATQTPQYRMDLLPDLRQMPVITADGAGTHEQLIDNLAHISRDVGPAVASQYDILPVVDTYISAQDRDLGGLSADVVKVVRQYESNLPRGTAVAIRGQIDTMRSSFSGLAIGLIFSVVLVDLADGGELPILGRSLHYHYGFARGAQRDCLDAVFHGNDFERAIAHGHHHVHRSGDLRSGNRGHFHFTLPGRLGELSGGDHGGRRAAEPPPRA